MHLHKLFVRVSSAALLLLAAAAPVSAADQPSAPSNEASVNAVDQRPAHATKEEPKEPKKICRSLEQTSSRLQTKKVCLTREQWRNAKYN
jgi:invasion protein IalB